MFYTLHVPQNLMCLRLGAQPVALLIDDRNSAQKLGRRKQFIGLYLYRCKGFWPLYPPSIYCSPLEEQQAPGH